MWRPIEGYEGLYEIDDSRTVRNFRTQRVLPVKSHRVTLCAKGVVQTRLVRDLRPTDTTPAQATSKKPPSRSNLLPASRLHHGPWATAAKSITTLIGDAGEHLVAFELAKRGIRSATGVLEGAPYDVIADFGGGLFFTVQVKTTSCAGVFGHAATPAYCFTQLPTDFKAIDLFAFVALDRRRAIFELAGSKATTSRRFSIHTFDQESDESIDRVLLHLYNRMK